MKKLVSRFHLINFCSFVEFVNSFPNSPHMSSMYATAASSGKPSECTSLSKCLLVILAVNKALPIPSPLNGSTRLAASPTAIAPAIAARLGWKEGAFFLGEPNGSCHPFCDLGTRVALANRCLNRGCSSMTHFCICLRDFFFPFCFLCSEISMPIPTFTTPFRTGNSQKYPGRTSSMK